MNGPTLGWQNTLSIAELSVAYACVAFTRVPWSPRAGGVDGRSRPSTPPDSFTKLGQLTAAVQALTGEA